MRLTVSQLRRLVAKQLDVLNEGELHWSVKEYPHIKVGNKFWVARPRVGGQSGVELVWSSDGRREGMDFPIKDALEQEALIKWLSDLELDLPPEEDEVEEEVDVEAVVDGPEDFPGDL